MDRIVNIVFGDCRECGGEPEGGFSSLGGADARRDDDQDQYLVFFRGRWMCERCRYNYLNEDQSRVDSERIRDEQSFLDKIGFSDSIT